MQKGGTRFNISSRESHANNKTVSIAAYCSDHLSYVLNGAKMQNLAERNCQNNFYVCSWFVERLQNFLRQCTLFMSTFTALHALYGNIWSFLFFFFISCNFNNHYICKIAQKKNVQCFQLICEGKLHLLELYFWNHTVILYFLDSSNWHLYFN